MKIKMRTTLAGPSWSANAEDIVNRPDAEAEDLIGGGYAYRVLESVPTPTQTVVQLDWDRTSLGAQTNGSLAALAEAFGVTFTAKRPTKARLVDAIMDHLENPTAPAEEVPEEEAGEGETEKAADPAGEPENAADPDIPAPRTREPVSPGGDST